MRSIDGASALSPFRKKQLLARLKKVDETITDISARYVHLIEEKQPLDDTELGTLKDLLTYGEKDDATYTGTLLFVVPRSGTISPWSSKATDIAHSAGLTNIMRIERGIAYYIQTSSDIDPATIGTLLHDRMTEQVLDSINQAEVVFTQAEPRELQTIDVLGGEAALRQVDTELGLALEDDEVSYLVNAYKALGRNPTDVELMMFGQVNSEHCRHKIFSADWIIDGEKQPTSLFGMIKNTYKHHSTDILSAYSDNAAVLRGQTGKRFFADADGTYRNHDEPIHSVIKVETHNHPTAISPFPGAATGTGGEIRDEGATGRGAKPKMGLAGYHVSNLNLPGAERPWEKPYGKPDRIASPLDIMIEAPVGAASFGNEFGRPNVTGYFRTYEQEVEGDVRGYHKPIMIAGGLGNIRDTHVEKGQLRPGMKIVLLGGPAMLIGLGGGAASSMQTGDSSEDLDFASVQRANPEMERRCQEVIDACWKRGEENPIVTIHDIGAGGYCVALSEFVHDSGVGGHYELRDIPNADISMSPMEIWCNEAQERYVLGLNPEDIEEFKQLCERERCPFAVVGEVTEDEQLVLRDSHFNNNPIDIPMDTLFGKPPKMTRVVTTKTASHQPFDTSQINLEDAIARVLQLPAVGSKKFLITIGDRNVGGLTMRDQMIGPWQVPVSDVAVTAAGFDDNFGEAMAMGERTPIALIDSPAAARIAIGETITNLLASDIKKLSDIKLSANWMAAANVDKENQNLYETVRSVGEDFCPELNLTIPVGKDSLSMKTTWDNTGNQKSVTSPLSLVITGFSPVDDVRRTLTPLLSDEPDTVLVAINLGGNQHRLGGSALSQVFSQLGDNTPDVEPAALKKFFDTMTQFKRDDAILAYHDRSDGGLFVSLAEMSFASRKGLDINVTELAGSTLEKLFAEELGAVIQIKSNDMEKVLNAFDNATVVATIRNDEAFTITDAGTFYESSRYKLEKLWADTSYQIQRLRDNPESADQEAVLLESGLGSIRPSVNFELFDFDYDIKPKVAIFRDQGVNGYVEMAAAFTKAGFTAVDAHLSDIKAGRISLNDFVGIAACGGFSYGDVLGAGEGWAKTILANKDLREQFRDFFHRDDTFTLGVCNGCQMLSALKELIPGAEKWPSFQKNSSEQFEARLVSVKINDSPSIFFKDMAGSILPVPVAHGEGRAEFRDTTDNSLTSMHYVDTNGENTTAYPLNPNGSPDGITALTTPDGRATIMMPHPERAFQTRQLSWHPADWGENSPWLRMFQNARSWINK
ncbi:MAG TPA: phosphoribosylformylglycinamidine synthase [Candidatus Saccharimonadales bacterium]